MSEIDVEMLPFVEPVVEVTYRRPKPCRHPKDKRRSLEDGGLACTACGRDIDPARMTIGRRAAKRGKTIQRQRIEALGGRNLAGNNPNLDGLGLAFAYESKSGPAAFSERVWRWLTDIPVRASETKVLIVTDKPGAGRKARSYVVVEFEEWRQLHGETR